MGAGRARRAGRHRGGRWSRSACRRGCSSPAAGASSRATSHRGFVGPRPARRRTPTTASNEWSRLRAPRRPAAGAGARRRARLLAVRGAAGAAGRSALAGRASPDLRGRGRDRVPPGEPAAVGLPAAGAGRPPGCGCRGLAAATRSPPARCSPRPVGSSLPVAAGSTPTSRGSTTDDWDCSARERAVELRLEPHLRAARLAARRHDAARGRERRAALLEGQPCSTSSTAPAGCASSRRRPGARGADPGRGRRADADAARAERELDRGVERHGRRRCRASSSSAPGTPIAVAGHRRTDAAAQDGTTMSDGEPARGRRRLRDPRLRPGPQPGADARRARALPAPRSRATREIAARRQPSTDAEFDRAGAGRQTSTVPLRGSATAGEPRQAAALAASPYAEIYGSPQRLTADRADHLRRRPGDRGLPAARASPTPRPRRKRSYPLAAFLFEDQVGYCQQFSRRDGADAAHGRHPQPRRQRASAPGTRDPDDKHRYMVADFDAHSWVEVYFNGIGWVTFDPTPAAAPSTGRSPDAVGQIPRRSSTSSSREPRTPARGSHPREGQGRRAGGGERGDSAVERSRRHRGYRPARAYRPRRVHGGPPPSVPIPLTRRRGRRPARASSPPPSPASAGR